MDKKTSPCPQPRQNTSEHQKSVAKSCSWCKSWNFWTKRFFPITVYVDNVGAIYIANNAVSRRTKHIDIRYHVIREYIDDGIVKIVVVTSENNVADIKPAKK